MGKPLKDITSSRFGRLVVLELAPSIKGRAGARWRCCCDCGSEIIAPAGALRRGATKSCGCYRREVLATSKLRHGLTDTRTHQIWRGMLKRCRSSKSAFYYCYGGRGIKVCERWQVFEHFFEDMGECPDGYSIERRDVNGDYEPKNCIWLPRAKQARNTRSTIRLTLNGETLALPDWCDRYGLRLGLVYDRIKVLGWSPERALTEPKHA